MDDIQWERPKPGVYRASKGDREVRITRRQEGLYWFLEGHHDYKWHSLGADREIELAKRIASYWLHGPVYWEHYQSTYVGVGDPDEEIDVLVAKERRRNLAMDVLQKDSVRS